MPIETGCLRDRLFFVLPEQSGTDHVFAALQQESAERVRPSLSHRTRWATLDAIAETQHLALPSFAVQCELVQLPLKHLLIPMMQDVGKYPICRIEMGPASQLT